MIRNRYHLASNDLLPKLDRREIIVRLKYLAKQLDYIDLIDPSSTTTGIVAEILNRIKKIT